jgi:dihydroxyacetone kinase
MELGLGIHGEPGVKRTQLQTADKLTEMLLGEIFKYVNFGEEKRVAVMVNNLGATTDMELAIVARHAVPFLVRNGYTVERIYAGTFLSSLDMAGISISVLGVNDEWLRWLDAPTTAPAWPNVPKLRPRKAEGRIAVETSAHVSRSVGEGTQTDAGRRVKRAIQASCKALINAEEELTELDRATGDGDLGASMRRAAMTVQSRMDSYPLNNVSATLKALGHLLQREMGGSSGPLYGVLFLRCGNVLENSRTSGLAQWVEAVDQGCQAISELGGAKPGDRTMLDALASFVKSLKDARGEPSRETLLSAVEAAERGAEATAQIKPRLGRSSYLGDRVLGHPDPGAKAIAVWLRAASEALYPL